MDVWLIVVCLQWSSMLGMCQHQQVWHYTTRVECVEERRRALAESRERIIGACKRKFVCQDFNCTRQKKMAALVGEGR